MFCVGVWGVDYIYILYVCVCVCALIVCVSELMGDIYTYIYIGPVPARPAIVFCVLCLGCVSVCGCGCVLVGCGWMWACMYT